MGEIGRQATTVKDKIETVLSGLVEACTQAWLHQAYFDNDGELLQILTNTNKQLTIGGGAAVHPEAVDEVDQFLELQG